jgi:hypothetical protein
MFTSRLRFARTACLLAQAALAAACAPSNDAGTPAHQTAAAVSRQVVATSHVGPARQLDAVQPELRSACDSAAAFAQRHGAADVFRADTAVYGDRSSGIPRYHACTVHVSGFADGRGIDPDLYKQGLPDGGWQWHPFEGSGGDSTYGLVRALVQCEITVLRAPQPADREQLAPGKASGFHIYCEKA